MRTSTHFIAALAGIRFTVSIYISNAPLLECLADADDLVVCFSAATVLLAACKCPDVEVVVGDPGFERDWARCLYILHHYEDRILSATQAIQVLEVMKQSVSGNGVPTQRKHLQGHLI